MSQYTHKIPTSVLAELPNIISYIQNYRPREPQHLSLLSFQENFIQHLIEAFPSWNTWTKHLYVQFSTSPYEPIVIQKGLGIHLDDDNATLMMLAITKSIFRSYDVPFYEVGLPIVTEVTPRKNASEHSHSLNILPAPPHSAGFFEPVPPTICVFACVTPHPFGGSETIVIDLPALLRKLSAQEQALLETQPFFYRTSKRLGNKLFPFKILTRFHNRMSQIGRTITTTCPVI